MAILDRGDIGLLLSSLVFRSSLRHHLHQYFHQLQEDCNEFLDGLPVTDGVEGWEGLFGDGADVIESVFEGG